jgi:hypothetical protein
VSGWHSKGDTGGLSAASKNLPRARACRNQQDCG